jgi:hypothetical protein
MLLSSEEDYLKSLSQEGCMDILGLEPAPWNKGPLCSRNASLQDHHAFSVIRGAFHLRQKPQGNEVADPQTTYHQIGLVVPS